MKHYLTIALLCFSFQFALGADFQFTSASYKEAESNPTYLRFDMKSTKLGLFTTSFTGFVKKFTAHAESKENTFSNLKIEFNADDIDTNIDGRNEKMLNLCLDSKNNPTLDVTLPGELPATNEWIELPGKIKIRNKEKPITASIKANNIDGRLVFDGHADLSIKELEIPDPSIAIAKVDDTIKVKFHFEIAPSPK